jgi:hypothetical protein
MPIAKPILFTIHGIYTDGPWQTGAASALDPFFEHHPVKYTEYRRMAIAKLAQAWLAALLLCILGLTLRYYRYFSKRWFLVLYLGICGVAVVVAHIRAAKGARKTMTELYLEMSAKSGNGPRPFVVAHSLGTYLLGRMLRHFENWSCHTIILTGCVLRRTFPWSGMTTQFHYVSNEVARMDLIPLAAAFLGLTVRDMGCAGTIGFTGTPQSVHNVFPSREYPNCKGKRCECTSHSTTPNCNANVHNIHHRYLRHSDYFAGKNHAWRSWLPTLWGYDPVLYRLFIEACQQCDTLERNDALWSEQDAAAMALRTTCWGWTYGTLEEFVQKELTSELDGLGLFVSPVKLSHLTDVIVLMLWRNVSEAARESSLLGRQKHEVLEHLNPRNALKRSIAATLEFT